MNPVSKVSMIGVPMDLGRGHRGVDMGPSALRIAGIAAGVRGLGLEFEDRGNVPIEIPERLQPKDPSARFLGPIAESCATLRDEVAAALGEGYLPLVVGGDHAIACGTIAAVSRWARSIGPGGNRGELGVIWFDAHADCNTPETSPTGNVHGMPLAACLGHGRAELTGLSDRTPMVLPENVVLVGIRSIDQGERELLRETGVRVYTMHDIDRLGMARVAAEAIEVASTGTAGFHLSFDLDGCDPSIAPGVGTPVRGGVGYRESHYLMEAAAQSRRMVSIEMTEIDPIVDSANSTAILAKELVLSALGQRIY